MKRIILLAVLAFLPSPPSDADEAPRRPPLPSPRVPPAPGRASPFVASRPTPDRDPPAPGNARPKAGERVPPPTIRLGEKKETDKPCQKGAGIILPAKFRVKADRGRLTAVLTGALQSNSFYGLPSDCVATIQLVQEFEIIPGDPEDPRVMLALSGKIDGYVSGEHKGTGALRRADATVYPADGGTAVWLAFPPEHNPSDSAQRYVREEHPAPLTLTAGRYVLVANLVLETTARSAFRDHGAAVFAPSDPKSSWMFAEENPFEDANEEDFGFTIVLRTATPPPD
jgi:hypothetical protein